MHVALLDYVSVSYTRKAVFKILKLDNDQHGDFYLLTSSFSIKCQYSPLTKLMSRGSYSSDSKPCMLSKANVINTYSILSFRSAGKIGFTFLLFSRDLKNKVYSELS